MEPNEKSSTPKINYLSYDEKKKNEKILKEMFELIEETVNFIRIRKIKNKTT